MSGIIYLNHTNETPGRRYHRALALAQRLARGDLSGLAARDAVIAKSARDQMNRYLVSLRKKEVDPHSVQDNKFLSNLSVQYGNDELIGLLLMPVLPVSQIGGDYATYDKDSRLGDDDDEQDGRADPNEHDDGERGRESYKCKGRSRSNVLDWVTMENEEEPFNEMIDLVDALLDKSGLSREFRLSKVLTDPANFGSNVLNIAAGDRWDSANGGNPVATLQHALAQQWRGRGASRNYAYCSLEVWNVLARHPAILDLSKHTVAGLATPETVSKYFGLDGILVSAARRRVSKKGLAPVYGRMYGNHFGVVRVAVTPSKRNAVFGYTLRWKGERTRVYFNPDLFTDGGYVAKNSHHEDYKVVAGDTGFLIQNPISGV